MKMILLLMFLMSSILMTLKHPLSMGLILISQTIISSFIMGYMMKSFFFPYIIMIIMLSGALILFIYMASVASNEKFKLSKHLIVLFMLITMFLIFNFINMKMQMPDNLLMGEQISLIKMFNMNTAKMTLMIIIYLLFTMIVVSNNAKTNEGPLRMKKLYE